MTEQICEECELQKDGWITEPDLWLCSVCKPDKFCSL